MNETKGLFSLKLSKAVTEDRILLWNVQVHTSFVPLPSDLVTILTGTRPKQSIFPKEAKLT